MIHERFDKSNKSEDYYYMARSLETGKWVTGFVVIEKPWYSPESQWKYYIMYNVYGGGGLNGGAVDLGLSKLIVDPSTIKPLTQTNRIEMRLENGNDIVLVEGYGGNEKVIAYIKPTDKIPYELWDSK